MMIRWPSVKASPAAAQRLPVLALLALAMTGFICILTETLPAGLLPQIGAGLHISPALAGQTVTAYATGSLIAALPLTLATRAWPRRRVLLATVLGFLLFNTLTAATSQVPVLLAARFMAGAAAGLAWSLLAGYARRMVAPAQQGRAMALAMIGTPVALSLGVPLGTWLGALLNWRMSFAAMSLLSLLLMVWILLAVPDFPGQRNRQQTRPGTVLRTPGIRAVLAVVFTWMLAHNILYTYVAPFVTPAGLADKVDSVLLVFGLAALAGIVITGRVIDRHLRRTVLASLSGFALTALAFALNGASPVVLFAGVAVWGLTFGGAATLLQTALADAAGEGADVALSLNVVTWNSAIALGGLAGGLLLAHGGVGAFPPVVLLLVLCSLTLAWGARAHGFVAGRRR